MQKIFLYPVWLYLTLKIGLLNMMYQKIADINLFHKTDTQAHHLQQVMDTEINSRPSEKFTLVVYNKLCAYCYRKFETVN